MKFLLKIFVFLAIILISKFTTEEPVTKITEHKINHPDAAFVHYLNQPDSTTAILKDAKEEELVKAYN